METQSLHLVFSSFALNHIGIEAGFHLNSILQIHLVLVSTQIHIFEFIANFSTFSKVYIPIHIDLDVKRVI